MILRKKKGSASVMEMLPVMLTIVMCGIMVIYFAGQAKYFDVCNEINNLARVTILKMESSRGLTMGERQKLQQTLASYGVTEISLAGTTEYNPHLRLGDEVTLCMNCKYLVPGLKLGGMMNLDLPGVERQIEVERSSVVLK